MDAEQNGKELQRKRPTSAVRRRHPTKTKGAKQPETTLKPRRSVLEATFLHAGGPDRKRGEAETPLPSLAAAAVSLWPPTPL